MAVVINEMEIVPAPAALPAQPVLSQQPTAPPPRVRLVELAQAQRRVNERAIRIRAH